MQITLDNRLGHEYLGDMRGQLPIIGQTFDRQVPSTCSTTKSTTPLQVVETGLSPFNRVYRTHLSNGKQEEPCQTFRLERLRRFRLLSEMDVLQDGQTIGKLSWLPTWAKSTKSLSRIRETSTHFARPSRENLSGFLGATWPYSSRGLSQPKGQQGREMVMAGVQRKADVSAATGMVHRPAVSPTSGQVITSVSGGHYFFGSSSLPVIACFTHKMAPPYVVTLTYKSILAFSPFKGKGSYKTGSPVATKLVAGGYRFNPVTTIPYQSVPNKSLGTSSRQIDLLHQPLHRYQVPPVYQLLKGDSNAIA